MLNQILWRISEMGVVIDTRNGRRLFTLDAVTFDAASYRADEGYLEALLFLTAEKARIDTLQKMLDAVKNAQS